MIARPIVRPQPIPFATPSPTPARCQPVALASPTVARHSPVLMSGAVRTAPHPRPVHATLLAQGALSVQSTATGRLYRFQGEGHRLQIDPHDALMLGRIPDLLLD